MSFRYRVAVMGARFLSSAFTSLGIFLISLEASGRAGGAGGGHSSPGSSSGYQTHSGNGDDSGSTLVRDGIDVFFKLPLTMQVIIFAGVVLFLYYFYGRRQPNLSHDIVAPIQNAGYAPSTFSADGFRLPPSVIPPMSDEELRTTLEKIRTGFAIIQNAWSQKTTSPMRRFISDGVYQRFNAQFVMMNLLDQTNRITDLSVVEVRPVNYFVDGPRECLDILIMARAFDQFMSGKHPQFNSPGGVESFGEVWSLVRQHHRPKDHDLFAKDQCPQCGADITNKLQDTASCPFCRTAINNGEYDWVVAEITQVEEYSTRSIVSTRSHLQPVIDQLRTNLPQFSRQDLEDRTSNAFLQILIGIATRQDDRIGRFTSANGRVAIAALQQNFLPNDVAFNRLYLSAVELQELRLEVTNAIAQVSIACEAQRVRMVGNALEMVDSEIKRHVFTATMFRTIDTVLTAKGSVYANTCPQCGAPQQDTLNAKCIYCSAVLNDPRYEWILDSIVYDLS